MPPPGARAVPSVTELHVSPRFRPALHRSLCPVWIIPPRHPAPKVCSWLSRKGTSGHDLGTHDLRTRGRKAALRAGASASSRDSELCGVEHISLAEPPCTARHGYPCLNLTMDSTEKQNTIWEGEGTLASIVSAGRPKKGLLFFSMKYFWRNGTSSGHGASQQRKDRQDTVNEVPGPGL